MRRLLWNLYAWPVTLILLTTFPPFVGHLSPLGTLDLVISTPSLLTLHLHIWDRPFLSARFWKPYAFGFIAWEFAYNLVLKPMEPNGQFKPTVLVGLVMLIPLYIALFKYAYRDWTNDASPKK